MRGESGLYSIDMLMYRLLLDSYLSGVCAGLLGRWTGVTDIHAAHIIHASSHIAVVHPAMVHVAVVVVHCYRGRAMR